MGIAGISAIALESGFGWANALSQDLIYEASELVALECHLFKGDANLKEKLERAKLIPGKSLIEAWAAIQEDEADSPQGSLG
jgi:hypothetical protein